MHYNMISFKFIIVGAVFLCTYLLTCIKNSESAIISNFNVVNYGAKCDGKTDDGKVRSNSNKLLYHFLRISLVKFNSLHLIFINVSA